MNHPCFALLDDAADEEGAPRSRLYRGHVATLACADAAGWPTLLHQMQQALAAGRHAVSVCAYELGAQLMGLPAPQSAGAVAAADNRTPAATAVAVDAGRTPPHPAPLAQILLFEHCAWLSQAEVADWLATHSASDGADAGEGPGEVDDAAAPAGIARVRTDVSEAQFAAALAAIHAYIEAGDTYQVNYTYRLHFDAFGSPCALYARLRARQPVPYGALIALPDGGAVLSLSPELFVAHRQGQLTARPMKGTAPAAAPDAVDDNRQRAAALAADPKNRAENLMIVDLLRNDMGRIGVTGSVKVAALFEVRRYSSVLQMTSTIHALLRADATLAEIFLALYPCGSITGAPKRRSMEIIAELEPAARGVYTGAIGWFEPAGAAHPVGDFCLSVPIRTLVLEAPRDGVRPGRMGVGAGIVYDSDTREEYAECQLKARFLTGLSNDFELFETMHASRADGVRHLERHLHRLQTSARYFGFACDQAPLRATLAQACAGFADDAPRRLRLALSQSGASSLHSAPLTPLAGPVRLLLSDAPTGADDLFLRHKTTRRARYDAGWRAAEAEAAFDTLFFNQRGELTEGGRSNVFVKLDGRWYTPPLASGVLPGVMRGVLLADANWAARERVLTRALLEQAEDIVVCNALRGAVRALLAPARR